MIVTTSLDGSSDVTATKFHILKCVIQTHTKKCSTLTPQIQNSINRYDILCPNIMNLPLLHMLCNGAAYPCLSTQ
jgi:hypothetical protein